MFSPKKRKKIATHNGSFHADDIFACATLLLWLDIHNEEGEIIRTRDEKIIAECDYVIDVGGVYNHDDKHYDHHQTDGAGYHTQSKILYASFGLVWEHYGLLLCEGDERVWRDIERRLVMSVDAPDNGITLYEVNDNGIVPYTIGDALSSFLPTPSEDDNRDVTFLSLVDFAKSLIQRTIKRTIEKYKGIDDVISVYNNLDNKEIVIVQNPYSRTDMQEILSTDEAELPDTFYIIFPNGADAEWRILGLRVRHKGFTLRKALPLEWRGLVGQELQKVTGVSTAQFCHRTGFMCIASSREGAISLAQQAIDN
ncbi:hypothetical protein A2997_01420 [Candidatus Nomurabacteria bacterium RIFCSPLOWO2_01_FULL_36_10b]|uniref:Metal-dependent hydrolase n=1 Tax=Candidatus Nomurabacteria bacterium RIFCSPLOWO2_01_FULL_36_10b TaxID=1801766 RepID=A0A1F6WN92_9BACT|nr:MAG: hypothetical protein A2997_01420 [Candidatus Nomurabacteria bacterium RIFCSPLOWO2_01_FULL_36_10b]